MLHVSEMTSANGKKSYAGAVPMVRRTVAALEWLAANPRGGTLSDLARALGISPSSLLALLTTLRAGDYVVRGDDGRYRVGPALAALGSSASAALNPLAAFLSVAPALAADTGETILLWQVEATQALLVAAYEGSHELRVVPRLGERIALADSVLEDALGGVAGGAVSTGPLPSGAWLAASAVLVPGQAQPLVLSIAGPAERVRRPEVADALRRSVPQLAGSADHGRANAAQPLGAGPLDHQELSRFLAQPLIASLAFLNEDGYPSTVPVRYHWDGAAFWLVPEPGAHWAEQLTQQRHVSLTISEAGPPLRRVNVQGLAAAVEDRARSSAIEAALRARYATAGVASPSWPQRPPVAIRVDPTRLVSGRGLRGRTRARGVA